MFYQRRYSIIFGIYYFRYVREEADCEVKGPATPEIVLNLFPDVNVTGTVDNFFFSLLVAAVEGDAVVALVGEVAALGRVSLLSALLGPRGGARDQGGQNAGQPHLPGLPCLRKHVKGCVSAAFHVPPVKEKEKGVAVIEERVK